MVWNWCSLRDKFRQRVLKEKAKLRKLRELKIKKQKLLRDKKGSQNNVRKTQIKVNKMQQRMRAKAQRQRDKVRRAKERLIRLASRMEAREKAKHSASKAAYEKMLKERDRRQRALCRKKRGRKGNLSRHSRVVICYHSTGMHLDFLLGVES